MGQLNSPIDNLTEVLNYGAEVLIAEDCQVDWRLTFCASTDQILTNYAVNQLDAAVPFESRSPNYGIDNFAKAKKSKAEWAVTVINYKGNG